MVNTGNDTKQALQAELAALRARDLSITNNEEREIHVRRKAELKWLIKNNVRPLAAEPPEEPALTPRAEQPPNPACEKVASGTTTTTDAAASRSTATSTPATGATSHPSSAENPSGAGKLAGSLSGNWQLARIALLEAELAAAQATAQAAAQAAAALQTELEQAQKEAEEARQRQAQRTAAATAAARKPKKDTGRKKDPVLTLAAGVVAGCIEATATWPLEYVKTQMQTTRKVVLTGGRIPGGVSVPQPYNSILGGIRHTIRTTGFFSLYTGLTPTLILTAPKSGIRFGTNQQLRNMLRSEDGSVSVAASFTAGSLAGVAEAVAVVTPQASVCARPPSGKGGTFVCGITTTTATTSATTTTATTTMKTQALQLLPLLSLLSLLLSLLSLLLPPLSPLPPSSSSPAALRHRRR